MSSADNQQERLEGQWIAGFVDGEGCFHVAINRNCKMVTGYQVLPEVRIVQHMKDVQILHRIRETLEMGVVRKNNGDRYEVRIRKLSELNKLIAFFEKYPLQTKKRRDFDLFKRVILLMNQNVHLCSKGLFEIARLAAQMNTKKSSSFLESSETLRQTLGETSEDKVRPSKRLEEVHRNMYSPS